MLCPQTLASRVNQGGYGNLRRKTFTEYLNLKLAVFFMGRPYPRARPVPVSPCILSQLSQKMKDVPTLDLLICSDTSPRFISLKIVDSFPLLFLAENITASFDLYHLLNSDLIIGVYVEFYRLIQLIRAPS